MRTFVVVGRARGRRRTTGAMPASRHACASVAAASSCPVTADERRLAAERRDVVRDVGGAADAIRLVIEGDDRHRRFGRDARHAADDERVEHRVADDEDVRARSTRRSSRARAQARAAAAASSPRAAANGSVTSTRKSIRNSESPKLYSKSPAASIASDGGQRRRGRHFVRAAVGRAGTSATSERDDEPEPDRERRQAALGGNLQRHVVQVRVDRLDRVVGPVLRVDAAAPCSGPTPVSGWSLTIRAPISIIASRSWLVGSCTSKIDITRLVTLSGASANSTRDERPAAAPVSRKSFRTNSSRRRRDAPIHALRVSVSDEGDDERRHDQRRPDAIAPAEEEPRGRRADHEHQQARVGHVVRQRALGAAGRGCRSAACRTG